MSRRQKGYQEKSLHQRMERLQEMVETGLASSPQADDIRWLIAVIKTIEATHDKITAMVLDVLEKARTQDQNLSDEWYLEWQAEEGIYDIWIHKWQYALEKALEEHIKTAIAAYHPGTSTMIPVQQTGQTCLKDEEPQTLHVKEATVTHPIVPEDAMISPTMQEVVKIAAAVKDAVELVPEPLPDVGGQPLFPPGSQVPESPEVGGQSLILPGRYLPESLHDGDQDSESLCVGELVPESHLAGGMSSKPPDGGGQRHESLPTGGQVPKLPHLEGQLTKSPRFEGPLPQPPQVDGLTPDPSPARGRSLLPDGGHPVDSQPTGGQSSLPTGSQVSNSLHVGGPSIESSQVGNLLLESFQLGGMQTEPPPAGGHFMFLAGGHLSEPTPARGWVPEILFTGSQSLFLVGGLSLFPDRGHLPESLCAGGLLPVSHRSGGLAPDPPYFGGLSSKPLDEGGQCHGPLPTEGQSFLSAGGQFLFSAGGRTLLLPSGGQQHEPPHARGSLPMSPHVGGILLKSSSLRGHPILPVGGHVLLPTGGRTSL